MTDKQATATESDSIGEVTEEWLLLRGVSHASVQSFSAVRGATDVQMQRAWVVTRLWGKRGWHTGTCDSGSTNPTETAVR